MSRTRPTARILGRTALTTALMFVMMFGIMVPGAVAAAPDGPHGQAGWQNPQGDEMYYVRPGDTLASIAMYYGTTVEALMRANGLSNPNVIYVGQVLYIPAGSPGMGGASCTSYHNVRYGETLSGIAYYYGVNTYALARANGLSDLNSIYHGQKLCIPDGYGLEPMPYGQSGYGSEPMQYGQPGHGSEPMQYGQPGYGSEPMQYGQTGYGSEPMPNSHQEQPMYGSDGSMGYAPKAENAMYYPGESMQPGMGGPEQPMYYPDEPMQPGMGGPEQPMYYPDEPMQPGMGGPEQPMYYPGESMQPGMGGPEQPMYYPDEPMQPGMGGPEQPMYYPDEPMQPGMRPDQPMYPSHGGQEMEFWKGSYFKDKYFSEFVEERRDAEVRFNWYTDSPGDNMPSDRFSIRWERIVYFPQGHYRFNALADDGVRVYVDDQTVIDGWQIQPVTEYHSDIHLGEGRHKVVVEYYEEAEDASIHVYWEPRNYKR